MINEFEKMKTYDMKYDMKYEKRKKMKYEI